MLRLITRPEWLAEAAQITLSSRGAHTPGVDGVNKAKLQAGLSAELQSLSEELLSGHYQPLPARRVYIPKSNGKLRPLGIPALRDRIVQRAMLMKAARRRISDARFMSLLWKTVKAGHVDVGLFRATSEGVPQGGVISPLLSNIMLNEFDQYLHKRYLSGKARKDRWYWNNSIQRGRSTAVRENWQWKPAVAYCRYADDFVLIVKGTKAQAEAIREECRGVLEDSLKLRLNMDKTRITHVNDGFIFLGHRIIRKLENCGLRSSMGDVGACWDNAVMKRFWGSLKHEWLLLVPQPTRACMKQDVAAYIRYYNLDRNHVANGELPPVRYEQITKKKVSCLT